MAQGMSSWGMMPDRGGRGPHECRRLAATIRREQSRGASLYDELICAQLRCDMRTRQAARMRKSVRTPLPRTCERVSMVGGAGERGRGGAGGGRITMQEKPWQSCTAR